MKGAYLVIRNQTGSMQAFTVQDDHRGPVALHYHVNDGVNTRLVAGEIETLFGLRAIRERLGMGLRRFVTDFATTDDLVNFLRRHGFECQTTDDPAAAVPEARKEPKVRPHVPFIALLLFLGTFFSLNWYLNADRKEEKESVFSIMSPEPATRPEFSQAELVWREKEIARITSTLRPGEDKLIMDALLLLTPEVLAAIGKIVFNDDPAHYQERVGDLPEGAVVRAHCESETNTICLRTIETLIFPFDIIHEATHAYAISRLNTENDYYYRWLAIKAPPFGKLQAEAGLKAGNLGKFFHEDIAERVEHIHLAAAGRPSAFKWIDQETRKVQRLKDQVSDADLARYRQQVKLLRDERFLSPSVFERFMKTSLLD